LAPALRLGCIFAWLFALIPAACLTALIGEALIQIQSIFESIEPVSISVLGQELARIDLLDLSGLQPVALQIANLVANLPVVLLNLFLLLVLAGGLLLLGLWLVVVAGYNLLGNRGLGMQVELEQKERG
jgi:hypothetical protein